MIYTPIRQKCRYICDQSGGLTGQAYPIALENNVNNKNGRYIYLLSAGHLFTDINQGALPAILPFFIAEYGFSYATAASLVFALNLISSIVQPLFGVMADKFSKPWVMSAGLLFASGGMAAATLTSNYSLIFTAIMFSGLGIAAFHPEAVRYANKFSGQRKGTGVSIFSFGGNLGFALGPIVASALILAFGLPGVSLLFLPTIALALVILSVMNRLHKQEILAQSTAKANNAPPKPDQWRAFSLLCTLVFSRSFIFFGLNTFIPLYWINVFNQTEATASTALSLMLGVGAISTLISGRIADRVGFKIVVITGFVLLLPLLGAFVMVGDAFLATLLLIPIGFTIFMPSTPMIVMGQRYLPNRIGLASGVTLGLAVSVGGIAAPLLGKAADVYGLSSVMVIVAVLAILPAILSFTLPKPIE